MTPAVTRSEPRHLTTTPNDGSTRAEGRSERHHRVVRVVVGSGRRFRDSPAGGACCAVVGVSGHDYREVPDHVHDIDRG
jgi:hypothetical protein